MKNNLETPYCLSVQSVLNEFSKYSIKLSEAKELGVKHEANATVNSEGLILSQSLKDIVLAPEFNSFVRGMNANLLTSQVALCRPHSTGLTISTYATAYELASMSLMFSNYCLMREGEFDTGTKENKTFEFLKNLSRKIHHTCLKIMGFLNGSVTHIMSHFTNSAGHEITSRGTFNGTTK